MVVPLVEQELPTLPEYLSSLLVFSGVRVTRSFVLCVCFVDRCLSLCTFSFGHCVVCSSSMYEFWLPLLVSSNSFYRKCLGSPFLQEVFGGRELITLNLTMSLLQWCYNTCGSCYSIYSFIDCCLSFYPFSFGHCFVYSS